MGEIRVSILAVAAAIAGIATAAPRYIGVATVEGNFWVDNAGVSSSATVFEGSSVETTNASARLMIGRSIRILLDVGSRAQVYEDHLLLEKGRGQLETGTNYRLEARTLRISLASPESRAVVAIGDSSVVEVASLRGGVRVANADGVLIANVGTGHPVDLGPEQGREVSVVTGCVAHAGRAYMMRDEVSAVTMELRGVKFASQAGKLVQVTGRVVTSARAVAPADQVIQASVVQVLASGCATTPLAAPSGSGERTAQTGGVRSPARVVHRAVIAGVGVAPGRAAVVQSVAAHGDGHGEDDDGHDHDHHHHHKPPISPGR